MSAADSVALAALADDDYYTLRQRLEAQAAESLGDGLDRGRRGCAFGTHGSGGHGISSSVPRGLRTAASRRLGGSAALRTRLCVELQMFMAFVVGEERRR